MRKRMTAQNHRQPNDRPFRLQRSVMNLQAIIDALDDELLIIDRDLRIVRINAAVLHKYGPERSAALGRPCYEVTHGFQERCHLPACECPAASVWESGKPVRVCHTHRHKVAGGTEARYVEIVASPLKDRRGEVIAMIELARDITEARRLKTLSVETGQNLLALSTIASTVSHSLDLDTVLTTALDKVLELMNGNMGGILLLDDESQTLSYRVSRGLSQEFVEGITGLKMGEGIAGRVAQLEQPIYVDDICNDPRLTRQVVIEERLRAFASVPLRSKRKLLGVMNIASHTPRRFRHEDVQILNSIANLVAVVIENAGLYNEMRHRDEMRGELLRQIISTQEEERERIARELHDETSQALIGLGVSLQAVMGALPLDTNQLKAQLGEIQSVAMKAHDEIHRLTYELRPRLLDDLGLVSAVESHVENQLKPTGVMVHMETLGMERRLPAEAETALFRIIQEATTNIIRHAGADIASVTLEFKEESIVARIEDNGRGFDIDQVMRSSDRRRGLGLLGMTERAEYLGGALSIVSRPGVGTQIAAEIPNSQEIPGG
jgi:signal transduction histidine kinase